MALQVPKRPVLQSSMMIRQIDEQASAPVAGTE